MVSPREFVHLIIKSSDLDAALMEVNARTAGIFGNVEARRAGECLENCMPAVFCKIQMPDGMYFGRVGIDPAYETLWPPKKYTNFEIMADYPAWVETTDPETGKVTKRPNREPYNCGTITDADGNTSDMMLGDWGC